MENSLGIPSDPKYFSHALRQISKDSKSLSNRLLSIYYDSVFVSRVKNALDLPLVSNLRCGRWYVQNCASTCYFKSTDGHHGNWSFSLSRLNLHVLRDIVRYGGVIIVDSTRKGKRFPDSLTKTIPIWMAVINSYLGFGLESSAQFYDRLSNSELASIKERLPGWVKSFRQLNINIREVGIAKPMVPFWISPDSNISLKLEEVRSREYYPVILLSASSNLTGRPILDTPANLESFSYVPGAADDEESWSLGLTPDIFWKHAQTLINHGSEDLETEVLNIVKEAASEHPVENIQQYGPVLAIQPSGEISLSIEDSIFNESVSIVYCGIRPAIWKEFREQQIWAPVIETKTGLIDKLAEILSFVSEAFRRDNSVLVLDGEDRDVTISIGVAVLLAFFDMEENGTVRSKQGPIFQINKNDVKRALGIVSQRGACIQPSRSKLKQIYNYFYKGSLFGLPNHRCKHSTRLAVATSKYS